ncbi:MAG: DUF1800 domain-containing protein [Chitinophagaceae bacterium]|nr:DUF1800 domain-containing protein [Chitinophagaceae bacterium]
MGDYNRKEFINAFMPDRKKEPAPYDINKDELVKKYGNHSLPLKVKRSRAGLSQYTGTWGNTQKIHLLRRLMFGAKPSDLAALSGLTMSQAVDLLINAVPPTPAPPVNFYEATYADPNGIPLGSTWINAPYGDGTVNYYRYLSIRGWWMNNILNQTMSIQEKMIVFWSNSLATEANVVGDSRLQYKYMDLLRTYALGNYKQFVKAMTKEPMMLFYLNGHYNIKNSPDENYARELQELFTIGKGTTLWNEDDVKAAAKVLTGFRANTTTLTTSFDSTKHETANKTFSAFYNNTVITGQSGAAGENELDDLLNMIFAKDTYVAKHICRKIYRFFVYYDIDANIESTIISGLAQTFINNNWDIKPVLLQLFKSDHFYDALTMDCYIRTPMDYYLGLMRSTGTQIPGTLPIDEFYAAHYTLAYLCEVTGMDPGSPPSVSGWPAFYQAPQFHQMWINSDTLPKRMKYTDALISNYGIYVNSNYQIKCDVLQFAQTLSTPSDPVALVDQCVFYLLAIGLSQSLKDYYKSILLSGQTANYYWTNAWNDYINNPGNATYEGIVRTRLQLMLLEMLRMAEHQLC